MLLGTNFCMNTDIDAAVAAAAAAAAIYTYGNTFTPAVIMYNS